MNAANEPGNAERIAVIGDSLMAGGRWREWFSESEILVLAEHEDTTDRLVDRLHEVAEARPDVVILLVGTNDFLAARSVEFVVRSTEYFLAMLRNELPGVRVLVHSIPPMDRDRAADIRDANRHLRQYAMTIHAQYLDLWPVLANDDGELGPEHTRDRVHLTEAGYTAWLAELRPALERLAEAPPMSRPISVIRARH